MHTSTAYRFTTAGSLESNPALLRQRASAALSVVPAGATFVTRREGAMLAHYLVYPGTGHSEPINAAKAMAARSDACSSECLAVQRGGRSPGAIQAIDPTRRWAFKVPSFTLADTLSPPLADLGSWGRMSVEGRMAARVILEVVLTVAGWVLVVTAVVFFVSGQPGPGIGCIVASGVAFAISASSFRRKTTAKYASEEMTRAMDLLRQGQYPQALVAAQKATAIASSAADLSPALAPALLLVATAHAANRDVYAARSELRAAYSADRQHPGVVEDFTTLAAIVERELSRGVPDPELLVREVLDYDGQAPEHHRG